jgi:hypothetical protein
MKKHKQFLLILFALFAIRIFAQAPPCNIIFNSTPNTSLCIGNSVTINALAGGASLGNGSNGALTVNSTVYSDGTLSAVSGAIGALGSNSITINSATGFSVGDEVLIITMQDAATIGNRAGIYEFKTISSISSNNLIFSQGLTNAFIASANIKHQVIKVPNYTNVTVNNGGVLTCSTWNGTVGGVLCFRANGNVIVNTGGSINANGKGYRGVSQRASICRMTDGGQGEGIYGTGIGSGSCNGSSGNNSGSWLSANGNGGGGGTGTGDSGGGGGGGYASAGTTGQNGGHNPGIGGNAVGNASLTLLIMGGAGGEGGGDEDGGAPGAGGNGGGVVYIAANTFSLIGTLSSSGNNGNNSIGYSGCGMAGGGGGAGGSIEVALVSFSGSGNNITVNGGAGGLNNGCGGNGGAGSVGRIRLDMTGTVPVTTPTTYQGSGLITSGVTYTWSTGSNSSSISVSPSITTVYNVTVSALPSCSATTNSLNILVVQLPTVTATSGSLCTGQSFTLNGGGAQTYSWTGSGINLNPPTGGVITYSNGYRIHTFTSSGVFVAPSNLTVSALVVAGGGGGGSDMGGGGGGGGVLYLSSSAVNAGSLNIVVGAGGAGASAGSSQSAGTNGGNSSFNGTTAIGGGGGGSEYGQNSVAPYAAKNGGSGGGAPGSSNTTAGTGTAGQGFSGGGGGGNYYPGGGGGAGGTGSINPGTGGPGIQYPTISPLYWAGGGGGSGYSGNGGNGGIGGGGGGAVGVTTGGAGYNNGSAGGGGVINAQTNMPGGNAGANTGGGGGGGSHYNSNNNGGNGGSGIVIIKYLYVNITVAITPTATTIYTLVGTNSVGCVSDPITTTVSVGPYPTLAVNSGSICSGQSFTITPSGVASYTIQGGSAIVSPTSNATYTVIGTSSLGCTSPSVLTTSVSVFSTPVISISSATNALCAGDQINLSANGASTYTWDNGSNLSAISASPATNTTYLLSGTSAAGCIGNTATLAVTVNALPVVTISGTNAICAGASAALSASGANTYSWNTGSTNANISISPLSNASYSVIGTDALGCVGYSAQSLTVNPLPIVNFSGNTNICSGQASSLTASGASTYTWSTNANTASISVSPAVNTTYSVTGTDALGCVGNSALTTITVNALPVVSITGTTSLCAGESINLSANGANTYTWNGGSNAPVLSITPATSTTYSLSGTSVEGCLGNTAVTTITVNALPVVTISGTNAICAGASAALSASGANTYSWNNGSTNANINVSPLSNTSYSVIGTDAFGCVGYSAQSLTVNALPIVNFSGNTSICSGQVGNLTASGASTYTWSTNANTASISVSPAVNTTYSVSGTDALGCVGNSALTTITVNALPVVSITGTNALCAGASINLSANGANTYTWNGGSNASVLSVTPATSTTYSLNGTSAAGCSGNTATLAVTVNTLPIVAISGTNAICAGASAALSASGANTYSWNTGSTNANINVSPLSNTSYTASGMTAAGCIGVAIKSITVNALPIVSISGNNTICAGASSTLTANGATTYTWSTNANTSSVNVSPVVNTSYSVSGTNAVGCSGNSSIITITVNALPLVSISGTTALCAGNQVTLAANGANTYTWNTGSNLTSIAVSPTANITYTLTGASAVGCLNAAVKSLTVNALPIVTISGASGICTGQNASLTANGANTYSWSTGSTSNSIVTTPLTNTTYSLIGVNALGCSNTATQLVTVQLSLSISISGPSSICEGQTANLSGLGGVTYTWNTGATSTTLAPTLTSTSTFSIIGASGTCSNTAIKTISVTPNPTVSVSGTVAICTGGSTTLTANGADTYSWSNGTNSSSAIVSPSTSTVYTVVGSYTTGCTHTVTDSITVYALPIISITGSSVVCLGDSISLTANGANSYVWNTTATTTAIVVSPTVNTNYSAVGTDTNGCVGTSAQDSVVVNPIPVMNIVASASVICAGDSVSFTASGANVYNWNTGSTDSTIVIIPTANTVYTVTGTNAYACSASAVTNLTVNALPTIAIAGANTICKGEETTLTASGASSYSWNATVNTNTLLVSPSINTSYTVTGTSAEGCVGTTSLQVTVNECTAIKNIANANASIKVYPNPNHGLFVVELVNSNESYITISNVLGQIILTQKAELVNKMDLSAFNKGMYFINILENNNSIYRTNVIVE